MAAASASSDVPSTAPGSGAEERPSSKEAMLSHKWWKGQTAFASTPVSVSALSSWDATSKTGAKGPGMTRFVFISDTHGMHRDIAIESIPEDADVLCHSGDISNVGEPN